ncbi:hypothetical protein [Botrimarina colliarenosi]|uniref:hypothetical protein n=1 Tax=Botrimarina colliarenosi TaxID=2528001 RepID=UPI0011B7E983|nr:hypothetical protein [Botrimarina colliarenosi]
MPATDPRRLLDAGQKVAEYCAGRGLGEEAGRILRLSRHLAADYSFTKARTLEDNRSEFEAALARAEAELLGEAAKSASSESSQAVASGHRAAGSLAIDNWSKPDELDRARDLAERGLELLSEVSRFAETKIDQLTCNGFGSFDDIVDSPEIDSWLERVINAIKYVSDETSHHAFSDGQISFCRCLRTIERSSIVQRLQPFRDCEAAEYLYPTAHAAATRWASAFQYWVTKRDEDGFMLCYEDASTVAEATSHFRLRPGEQHRIGVLIVEEWRAAHEFIDRQPLSEFEAATAEPDDSAGTWAERLSVLADRAVVMFDGTPYPVSPDSATIFAAMLDAYPDYIAASKLTSKPDRLAKGWPDPLKAIVDRSQKGYRLIHLSERPDTVGPDATT